MSIAASSPGPDGFLSRRFWIVSFAAVAGLHLGAGATVLFWRPSGPAPAEPAAAIMVELAPAPSAPPEPVRETPPGPEQVETPPQPEPVPDPEPKPLPEIEPPPVIEKAEAVLPPAPDPEPEEEPVEEETEAVEETTAPASVVAPPDEVSAAPAEGAPSLSQSARAVSWQSALLGRLERFKRYPSEAQRARREGVVYIRFTMDRDGKVLSKRIEQSSGEAALDREALDLLDRAQPLPPPPPDVQGEVIELVVPIEFFMKR